MNRAGRKKHPEKSVWTRTFSACASVNRRFENARKNEAYEQFLGPPAVRGVAKALIDCTIQAALDEGNDGDRPDEYFHFNGADAQAFSSCYDARR